MPIWEMPAITEQPTINLIRWTVVRFKTENLQADFVYGWDVDNACGRTSSVISGVDRDALSVRTRSGRIYRLCGQAGRDAEGEYVFREKYPELLSLCAGVRRLAGVPMRLGPYRCFRRPAPGTGRTPSAGLTPRTVCRHRAGHVGADR